MAKRTKTPIIAGRGSNYVITFDRNDGYCVIIDRRGVIGYYALQSQAQAAVDSYNYETLKRAA
jgi:hypothetical protein